jgi:hypothetical protein
MVVRDKVIKWSISILTLTITRNPRLKAEEVGWISGSASTMSLASVDALPLIHPVILSDFLVF